jgi:hypothetical protein
MQKLIIYNAQFEDEAEYRCSIMDKFVSAKLTVNGKYLNRGSPRSHFVFHF